MAATFNPALTTPLDKVRHKLGDTDVSNAIEQDETIDALLAEEGATPTSVAASLARTIAAKFARRVTYDVDGQGERFSDLYKNYLSLAEELAAEARAEASAAADEDAVASAVALGGGIMVGGLRTSENIAKSEDPERAANYGARYR